MTVNLFDREAAAVAEATAGEYGPAAGVFCRGRTRAARIAAEPLAGTVWINCAGPALLQSAWRGFKGSGIGRELGRGGLDSYAEPQQLTSWLGPAPPGWSIGR